MKITFDRKMMLSIQAAGGEPGLVAQSFADELEKLAFFGRIARTAGGAVRAARGVAKGTQEAAGSVPAALRQGVEDLGTNYRAGLAGRTFAGQGAFEQRAATVQQQRAARGAAASPRGPAEWQAPAVQKPSPQPAAPQAPAQQPAAAAAPAQQQGMLQRTFGINPSGGTRQFASPGGGVGVQGMQNWFNGLSAEQRRNVMLALGGGAVGAGAAGVGAGYAAGSRSSTRIYT